MRITNEVRAGASREVTRERAPSRSAKVRAPASADATPQRAPFDLDALERVQPAFAWRSRERLRRPASGSPGALADARLGLVTREELGVSSGAITGAVRRGELRRVASGLYTFGHAHLRDEAWLLAALLDAGEGAAISHETAAWWWGLCADPPARIHVSSPRSALDGFAVCRHRYTPGEGDVVVYRGLPVTSVARTLLDVAVGGDADVMRRLISQAAFLRRVEPEDIRVRNGHRGSAALRVALERWAPELAFARSELEQRFVLLLERFALPAPRLNEQVLGLEVDAVWPGRRLIVELDGWAAHGTREAFETDRRRDRRLTNAGYRVLRFTWREVVNEQPKVAEDLRRALASKRS